MGSTPTGFDFSQATRLTPSHIDTASSLQGAVYSGTDQNPDEYAKLLQFQKLTGVPPAVSKGALHSVQQVADVNSINYPQFAAANPRTTAWASNPDNAAVSGVGEIQRLGGIEQNAATMRSALPMIPGLQASANLPTRWESLEAQVSQAYSFLTGKPQYALKQSLYDYPLTRAATDIVGGATGLVGNVGAAVGWHGDGPTKQNLLQRIESGLSPEANTDPLATFHKSNGLDWLAGNVAPMVPAVLATGGTSLLADTLGISSKAAKVLAGLSVGAMFDADQAGKTYTAVAGGGGSDYDARLAANRVAAINALPNALFGATDVVPLLRDNPLLTSLGLGGFTGASGQFSQNVVTGKPWAQGVPAAMLQGAAMQGGMHIGMGAFAGAPAEGITPAASAVPPEFAAEFKSSPYLSSLAQQVGLSEASQLRERAPDKFYEAMGAIHDGDPSLRIPAEQFSSYFQGQGVDPAEVARGLGSTNYAEAVMSGGDVEIPPADFLSKLDPEHQKALLPDVVDPSTDLSARQRQEGTAELEQWVTGGGADKLVADTAAADAETAASPEYQEVHEQLRQKYLDAGETPEVAETLATKDANAYSNLARSAGMKPSELLGLYNPKVVSGEAPEATEAAPAKPDLTNPEYKALHEKWYEKLARQNPEWGVTKLNREAFEWADSEWASKSRTVVNGEAPEGGTNGPDSERNQGLDESKAAEGETLPVTFKTAKGSTYVVNKDGTTTRNKAFRPEHGEAEQGPQPTSEKTFYVSPEDAVKLGEIQARGAGKRAVVLKDGNAGVQYLEGKDVGKIERRTFVPTQSEPAVGLTPVETWENGARVHFGNEITEVSGQGNETLNQSSEDGARGWFRVLPDGTYEIGKTKIGDLSTFVHEPAHAYLKILGDLAKREGASDVLKGDYQKVLDFLGAKDGEPFTRDQQETWARANEQYLREGKAPSNSLKGAFQRFAIWLHSVYEKASNLGVELTPEIRDVFDRLYAAEEGVNKAENESGPKLFTSAEEAGWNDVQFKAYAEMNSMSIEQAKASILGMMNDAAVREKTDAWRSEEENVRAAMTETIDASQQYKAIRALRKGKLADGTAVTINRDELVNQFGEDRVKDLQKQHPGMYRNEGGLDPETAAEMLGFNSAHDLMSDIETLPRRRAAIEQATREYMTAKHGDIRYDGSLNDQARVALENDKRAETLHGELKALKKKLADVKDQVAGQKQDMRAIDVAPIDAYREAAQQMVEAKAVADLQPTRYMDAARKYSREAFDALRKGDAYAAEQAKHRELLNHFLFREATKAKEYVGKVESYAKRMQTRGVQEKLGLAGGDFRDQFNRVLGRYGLGPGVPAPERSLMEWSQAQYDEGKEPAIAPTILNESRTVNYRNAPVAEIRLVHDALVNIRKLASLELGMEVNGRKIEFATAMQAMDARAHDSLKTKPTRVLDQNATAGENATNYVQRGDALLARTEFLMKRLDGGVAGPWHDNLWNLASDAQGNEYKLQEEVTQRVGDALQAMPKEQRMRMLDKVNVDGISETVTRKDLVSMAFNLGNDGNRERLEKTFAAHGWEPRAIDTIQGMLTREEWQFVQDGWDSLKPLGQAQSELERRMTGLPPVMVKPTPLHIDLADGSTMDLEGGYYPVVMDPRFSARGATADAGATAQNLMEAGYGRATTSRGNMKERTGFGGAMQLDYEQVLTQHTAKVIKDITHREFMLVANKLLLDPQIRQTLRETLGAGYEEKMLPWLRTIINDRNGSAVQGLGDLSRLMGKLRTNLVKASLGFKASTMLLQLTHASSIFLHTSPGSYAQAMVDFLAHPSEMTEEIRNLSPNEMHNRGENIDRDMRQVLQQGIGKQSLSKIVAKAGMFPVKMMDHVLSFPLWKAVYQDALKENLNLPEDEAQRLAMHKADGAVRMGLGSNAPKDLPPVMRNNDFWKVVTTLGGFHNLKYNQIVDVGRDFGRNRSYSQLTYRLAMAAIIPAVVGAYVTGRRPKDDENAGEWAAKRALLFAPETVPLLGNVIDAAENHGDVRFSPLVNIAEKAGKAAYHAGQDKEDKDWTGIGMDAGEAAGEAFGVPGTEQVMKTLRYARRAQAGNIADPNAWDAVVGAAHK